MFKRKGLLIILLALVMLFVACEGPDVTQGPTATEGNTPTTAITPGNTAGSQQETASGKQYQYDENGNVIQQPDVRDYTTMWWRDGFNRGGKWQLNFQTGYYGLTVNTINGSLKTLGAIKEEISETEANKADNAMLDALPQLSTSYQAIGSDGTVYNYISTDAIGGGNISSRILETGHFMQRIDIMSMKFKGLSDAIGRVEIAVMPEYFSLGLDLFSPDKKLNDMGVRITVTLPDGYTSFTESCNGRAVTVTNKDGSGYSFILPNESGTSYKIESPKKISFTYKGMTVKKADYNGMGIIVIPSVNASAQDAINYIAREKLESSAVQITPNNGKSQKAEFDTHKGYLSVDMNRMMTADLNDFEDPDLRDDMDRLKFTVTNNSGADIKLPIQFVKTGTFGVHGMCPMIRDAETGEPIGVQVQLSKNWHEPNTDKSSPFYAARNDPKRIWSGFWFHGYTVLEIPAGKSITYEMTIAYATWGGVYGSSHAQISLAGWGGNYQQWETSSIGSFGEAFCYDPETAHGRAFIDDIRPLNVMSMGGKYGWTACNGGGNMLFYNKTKNGNIVYFKQVQTYFKKQGPNLTEVIYTGTTLDDAVRFEITAYLPRTNDVSRAWHCFKYTFLKDVTFDRMAFYQFGADNYNDNIWNTMAVGNNDGTISFNIGNKTYSGQFESPTSQKAEYVGGNGPQRIEIPGEGMWFAFMNAVPLDHKQGPFANRMLNVVEFSANINGKHYSKPSFSLRNSMDYGFSCIQVELCPPAEVGNTINARSVVTGTVEYINLPIEKSHYYGPSEVLNSIPASEFNTWKAAYRYAVGNKTTTTAAVGEVTKQAPIFVKTDASAAQVVAQITVKGGMSYVPLTFTGLTSNKGYQLQVKEDDQWKDIDQSVHGNDYWQCWYDAQTKTYELTYNVEHSGKTGAKYTYRLIKK